MRLIDFGVPFAGSENWDGCIAKGPEECMEPKPSAWTESIVQTIVTSEIRDMVEVMNYFGKRIFPGSVMNSMLVYMEDNQAQGVDGAIEFLENYPEIWLNWVTLEASEKVIKAL